MCDTYIKYDNTYKKFQIKKKKQKLNLILENFNKNKTMEKSNTLLLNYTKVIYKEKNNYVCPSSRKRKELVRKLNEALFR